MHENLITDKKGVRKLKSRKKYQKIKNHSQITDLNHSQITDLKCREIKKSLRQLLSCNMIIY